MPSIDSSDGCVVGVNFDRRLINVKAAARQGRALVWTVQRIWKRGTVSMSPANDAVSLRCSCRTPLLSTGFKNLRTTSTLFPGICYSTGRASIGNGRVQRLTHRSARCWRESEMLFCRPVSLTSFIIHFCCLVHVLQAAAERARTGSGSGWVWKKLSIVSKIPVKLARSSQLPI